MKHFLTCTITLLLLIWATPSIKGQTVNQSTWMIGGSAGFSSTKVKNEDDATTVLDLSPTLGLFIIDDLAVGLGIGFNSTSIGGNTNSSFGLGPLVRYYLTDPIFAQAHVDIGLDDESGTSFGVAIGYSWFLDNTLAIEPALFFSTINYDGDEGDATTFGLSIGIQAFAGRD